MFDDGMFNFGHDRFLRDRRLRHGATCTAVAKGAHRCRGHRGACRRGQNYAAAAGGGCGGQRDHLPGSHFSHRMKPAVPVGQLHFRFLQQHYQLDDAENAKTLEREK